MLKRQQRAQNKTDVAFPLIPLTANKNATTIGDYWKQYSGQRNFPIIDLKLQ